MLNQFRKRYPHGSLISELVQMDRGKYIVRALIQIEGVTIATGLAAADTVEQAEDSARNRALSLVDLEEAISQVSTSPRATHSEAIENKTLQSNDTEKTIDSSAASSDFVKTVKQAQSPKVATQPIENSDRAQPAADSILDRESVEPEESLPLLSNGVTSTALALETQTSFEDEEEAIAPSETEDLDLASDEEDVSTSSQLPLEPEPSPPIPETTSTTAETSFEDIIDKTNLHLKRLKWTNEQGRLYLLEAYGKRSRHLLTNEELLEFLQYLESLPD
jgi:hypothetical protein